MAAENKEQLTFEQAAGELDEIVRTLEKGDAPLDKSLEMFEKGAALIKLCNRMLDEAELKVTSLQTDGDRAVTREVIVDDDE